MIIRITDCAAEPPRSVPALPSWKHLVDQGLRGAVGAAAGRGVNDAERIEENVGDVYDDQEERGRREQREDDGPEPPHRPCAVDRRGLDHAFRDRLQPGEKEQEIVADLVPDRDDDDEDHRMGAVQHRIPVDAIALHRAGDHAEAGLEHEDEQHARHRRRHRIGHDQKRTIDLDAAQVVVGHHREQQAEAERESHHQRRKHQGDADRLVISGGSQQIEIVLEPDELGRQPEGVLHQERLLHGLQRRPIEKDQGDRKLRQDQKTGQQPA